MGPSDLRARLDASIGSPPRDTVDPLAGLLREGHRVVRRRRVATGAAGALAAVLVLGGAALATGGSTDRASAPPVASSGSSAPDAPSSPAATPTVEEPPSEQARFRASDAVEIVGRTVTYRPGAVELQRLDLTEPGQPDVVVAVEYTYRGRTWWAVEASHPDGSANGARSWAPGATEQSGSFEQWAREQAAGQTSGDTGTQIGPERWPGSTDLDLVEFVGDTAELRPVDGATVLDQRPGVDVGSSWADPDDRTAAAEVRAGDGQVYYVLARTLDPDKPSQYIAVPQAEGGADLDAFLATARERYAEGGGGLL